MGKDMHEVAIDGVDCYTSCLLDLIEDARLGRESLTCHYRVGSHLPLLQSGPRCRD